MAVLRRFYCISAGASRVKIIVRLYLPKAEIGLSKSSGVKTFLGNEVIKVKLSGVSAPFICTYTRTADSGSFAAND